MVTGTLDRVPGSHRTYFIKTVHVLQVAADRGHHKCDIGPRVMHLNKFKAKSRDIACDSCSAWKAKGADPE
jgi:hypothetical protein